MSESSGIFEVLIDRLPGLSGLATSDGPFFFGVFLVIVSIIVLHKRDNRSMGAFYAVSGIVFMGLATFSFLQSSSAEKIYPYRITLTNLPKDSDIHLPLTVPRMYRDNVSTSLADARVEVAILSPEKLEPSRRFSVQLLAPLLDEHGDPTGHRENVGRIVVPFNGASVGIYSLRRLEDQNSGAEEDGDLSAPRRFEFVEDATLNASAGGGFFDRFVSALVSDAVAADKTSSAGVRSLVGPPIPPLIVYYRKDADGNSIERAIGSVAIQSIVKSSDLGDTSNAIWVGIDVPAETIDGLVRSMLDNGVELRHIGHFEDVESKTNIVQIGTSVQSQQEEKLSAAALEDFIRRHAERKSELIDARRAIVEEAAIADQSLNRKLKSFSD